MQQDCLTPELRLAEREVDAAFKDNGLLRLSFGEAAWYLLAVGEDLQIRDGLNGKVLEGHDLRASIDNYVNELKWPIRWIRQACSGGGSAPTTFQDDLYGEATELLKLSDRYESFESAFSYASWGLARLDLEGRRIRTSGAMRQEERYDAYDRLTEHLNKRVDGKPDIEFFYRHVGRVTVSRDRFWYPMNSGVVVEAVEKLRPVTEPLFNLPTDCKLTGFSIGEFRKTASALSALAWLHLTARMKAAQSGCYAYGILHAILTPYRGDLIRRLHRATGVKGNVVANIIDMLTFGLRDQRNPDIALQPLIQTGDGRLLISPSLLCSLSLERNLTVLANRIPEEQQAYSLISASREQLSRENIKQRTPLSIRTWQGDVPSWGGTAEIDLVLISDVDKIALILELKSFISPAEPREIVERSEELQRGVEQLRQRQKTTMEKRRELNQVLQIDDNYTLHWAVCSDNSIGASYIQTDDIPIVMTEHLIHKLLNSDLPTCCAWLASRSYLPEGGRDFQAVETISVLAGWELEWYAIRCLTAEFGVAT